MHTKNAFVANCFNNLPTEDINAKFNPDIEAQPNLIFFFNININFNNHIISKLLSSYKRDILVGVFRAIVNKSL